MKTTQSLCWSELCCQLSPGTTTLGVIAICHTLLDMPWNRRSSASARGWEAEDTDKEKTGSHRFFKDLKNKSWKIYSENAWRSMKSCVLTSPTFLLPCSTLCSAWLYPTNNMAAASLVASNLFLMQKMLQQWSHCHEPITVAKQRTTLN